MKKVLKWGAIVIVGLIVIGAVAGSGSKEPTGSTSTGNQQTTPISNKNEGKVYAVNEDATVGEVRWKLLEAKDNGKVLKASQSRYKGIAKDKTADGNAKFIQVKVEVENLGKEMKSVTSLKLIDSQGREFTSSSDTLEWIPEGKELYLLANLNPNVAKEFVDIYQVPTDATGLKLKVGDLAVFGSKEALIDLSL